MGAGLAGLTGRAPASLTPMQLPGKMGELDFSNWVMGLGAAFIGGGAGAFSAGLATIVVDPRDFNIYTPKFWQVVFGTFVISGLGPFFAFLHTKPLPDVKQVTTMTQTVIPSGIGDGGKVIETVKETHTEPIVKGDK